MPTPPRRTPITPPIRLYSPEYCKFLLRVRSITRVQNQRASASSYTGRPRPFYFMPRGFNTILAPATFAALSRQNEEHPRIRKHIAFSKVIHYFHLNFDVRREHDIRLNRIPPMLTMIVNHYNNVYLCRPTDIKLSSILVWKFTFRRSFSKRPKPPLRSMSHQAIYIQQRYNTPNETKLFNQRRHFPACQNQIGIDYHRIRTNTTIAQPDGVNLFYLVENLHSNWHGSVDMTQTDNLDLLFDYFNIQHGQISPQSAGGCRDGIQSMNNIYVAYKDSLPITLLERAMVPCGLNRFHDNLTRQLLIEKGTDPARMSGQVVEGETSLNHRLTFGYGRVQPTVEDTTRWKVHPWTWKGEKMPTIRFLPFKVLPEELKPQLIKIFEAAQLFVDKNLPGSFPVQRRTKTFSKLLNEMLGYPKAKFKFEYFDIVLSLNTILPKHIDSKNDNRQGYNLCCVYSFYQKNDNVEYKVSIIMTTRSAVGAAYDKGINNE